MRRSALFATIGAVAFTSAGGLATAAVVASSGAPPPQKTVTITVGGTGPTGPSGSTGATGTFECLDGYVPGILVINHPGGQTKIYTCIEGP
jgi:hypothetical protein